MEMCSKFQLRNTQWFLFLTYAETLIFRVNDSFACGILYICKR